MEHRELLQHGEIGDDEDNPSDIFVPYKSDEPDNDPSGQDGSKETHTLREPVAGHLDVVHPVADVDDRIHQCKDRYPSQQTLPTFESEGIDEQEISSCPDGYDDHCTQPRIGEELSEITAQPSPQTALRTKGLVEECLSADEHIALCHRLKIISVE